MVITFNPAFLGSRKNLPLFFNYIVLGLLDSLSFLFLSNVLFTDVCTALRQYASNCSSLDVVEYHNIQSFPESSNRLVPSALDNTQNIHQKLELTSLFQVSFRQELHSTHKIVQTTPICVIILHSTVLKTIDACMSTWCASCAGCRTLFMRKAGVSSDPCHFCQGVWLLASHEHILVRFGKLSSSVLLN